MALAREIRAAGRCCAPAAALAALAVAGPSMAGMIGGPTLLEFDVNSVVVQAEDDFDGSSYTGSLLVSQDASAGLADLRLGGVSRALTAELSMLDGRIDLENGQVVGGFFQILLDDGSEFSTSIGGTEGVVEFTQAEGFAVDGLTENGTFDDLPDGAFGGVDLAPILNRGSASSYAGSFLLFAFNPNEDGIDADANLEIYLTIPSPGGAALFGLAAATAMVRRR